MRLTKVSRRALLPVVAAGAIAVSGLGWAAALDKPSEKSILTISGKISSANKDGTAEYDRPMLEALGTVSFETTTPWFAGTTKFEGVPMAKLMQQVGAAGSKVVVV